MRPREVLQKTCSGQGVVEVQSRRYIRGPPLSSPRRTTCLFYQAGTHARPAQTYAHVLAALYGRPPLHCVNTIHSLRLDLDYLESTCNAHIRSAAEDVFHVTMASTCPPAPRRDTPKKITILKKQCPLEYT